ncbi:MAG: hypothetical protein HY718_19640 [Planctomycetes bacterium]|nr:hypothetical protein [Planctomycetota bacterium]
MSLFPGDQAVMSDVEIGRALNTPVSLPAKVRIAVMRFEDHGGWAWWSEEISRMDADSVAGLLGKLRACDRVSDASPLPAMLMPIRRDVPNLRVAAARYQADAVLVYQVRTRQFERQRFLQEKETKARCQIDAVLIDVRSGIIPFASSIAEAFVATKAKDDFNEAETMYKAELQATARGLAKNADELTTFLKTIPVGESK